MKCITCGINEVVNDFYKECEGCIEEYRLQEEMRENNERLLSMR